MKRRNRVVVATVLSCLMWAGLAGRREVFALLPVAPVEGCLTCPAGFKTGVPDTNRRDDKGRRQGLWVEMGRKGSLSYRGHFKDDMPEGRFVAVHLCSCMLLSYRYHSSSSILIKVVKSFFM